jgi:hypothetical protein
MGLYPETALATIYDRMLQRIQRHFANQVKFPFELR